LVSGPVLGLLNCVDVFLFVSHLTLSLDLIWLDLFYPFGLYICFLCICRVWFLPPRLSLYLFFLMDCCLLKKKKV
jgi:hypothetical protein